MEITKMVVDAAKEQAGVWVDYDETTKFRIGSLSSRRYKQAYQDALEEIKRKSRRVTSEQGEQIQIEVFSQAVVLEWEGVRMKDQPYPCTPENVKYVLTNCPQVREFVVAAAGNYENFKAEQVEVAKAQLGES